MASNKNRKRSDVLNEQFNKQFLKGKHPEHEGIQDICKNAKLNNWEVFLFGGIPRSLWLSEKEFSFRDFDLVVADESFSAFCDYYKKSIERTNRFGGIKLKIANVEYDVWALSSTWAFKEGYINESFENLPKTTFLDIDAIVFELAPQKNESRRVFHEGFYKSAKERCLGINLQENPFVGLCVLRTIKIASTQQFSIDLELAEYICDYFKKNNFEEIIELQYSHYGRLIYELTELENISQSLLNQMGNNAKKFHLTETIYQDQVLTDHYDFENKNIPINTSVIRNNTSWNNYAISYDRID